MPAIPLPVAPPPMTRTSNVLLLRFLIYNKDESACSYTYYHSEDVKH